MKVGTRVPQAGGSGQGGFTLIELMIVVAVIAVLAAIAYPSYEQHVLKSRRAQAKADLIEYTQLAERHHTVANTYEGFSAPTQSPRQGAAHYRITLSDVSASGFLLTASPQPESRQSRDACGALSINAAGVRTHETGDSAECDFGTRR